MEKNENFEQQLLLDKVHPDQKKILPSFCPLGKRGQIERDYRMYKKLPHFSVQIYVWYGSKVWIGITVAMKKKILEGRGESFSHAPL